MYLGGIIFFLAPLYVSAQRGINATTLDLPEDAVCKTKGEKVWVCKTQNDCKHIRGDPQVVCSFQGKQPVVCCPPNRRPPRSLQKARASRICEKYNAGCVFGSQEEVKTPGTFRGQLSLPTAHPHMALIGYDDNDVLCTGSLISEYFVLTSTRCSFHETLGSARWVQLGTFSRNNSAQRIGIEEIVIHPEFSENAMNNDIALLRLRTSASFNEGVKPACLHNPLQPHFKKAKAFRLAAESTRKVSEENLEIIPTLVCRKLLERNGMLSEVKYERIICTGTRTKTKCSGFSGDVLMVKPAHGCLWSVMGVSGRTQCPLADSFEIYNRVSHYLPWIESVVWS